MVVALSACERPFVDVSQPDVVILSPDLAEVLETPQFALRLRAGSFRNIDMVTVNGMAMEYSSQDRVWSLPLRANRGLNQLILEARDVEGITSIDTAYALHMPVQFVANSPALPAGRAGHSTTRTPDRDIIVIGGASHEGGPGHTTIYILTYPGSGFLASSTRLREARTGHTATLLHDGRILVVGGSRADNINSVADLVEEPEVFDPKTETVRTWVVIGEPIRRALHTAVYRRTDDADYVDLYGGLGDTRYGNEPYLGVRADLRTFRIQEDTLVAENSLATAPYLGSAIYGHTLNRIQIGPYYVFGGRFESNFQEEASFSIEYNASLGLLLDDVPPLHIPRTRHAAAPFLNNLLFISGGHQYPASSIVTGAEFFSQTSETMFRLSRQPLIFPRFGHTATATDHGEVLIIGGFGPDGTAQAASEFFVILPGGPQEQSL